MTRPKATEVLQAKKEPGKQESRQGNKGGGVPMSQGGEKLPHRLWAVVTVLAKED